MTPLDAWSLLITDDMIDTIVRYTNRNISDIPKKDGSDDGHVSVEEMRAFIETLILAGLFKSGHEDVRSLWSSDLTGRPICRTVMARNRFLYILPRLRFDDTETREEQRHDDPLALVSDIFNSFINNSRSN